MSTRLGLTGVLRSPAERAEADALRYLVPVGRLLLAAPFVLAGPTHFNPAVIGFAAAQGVPYASVLVPLSGLLAAAGGLSILLGYRARLGAALVVLFLIPVTLVMHRFWGVPDPMMTQMQQAMFMKNFSMLGGVLLVWYFGAGPLSFDARRERASIA
jgi:putative oxidoreductase